MRMVPIVFRKIVRKNERQADGRRYDVLICTHAVLVDTDARANTYRRARACPACRAYVEKLRKERSK